MFVENSLCGRLRAVSWSLMISALLRDTQVPKYLFKHQCGYAVKVVVDEISGL